MMRSSERGGGQGGGEKRAHGVPVFMFLYVVRCLCGTVVTNVAKVWNRGPRVISDSKWGICLILSQRRKKGCSRFTSAAYFLRDR